jgi:hypothetical protein
MWCAMGQCYEHEQLGLDEGAIRCYRRALVNNDREGIALHKLVRGRGLTGCTNEWLLHRRCLTVVRGRAQAGRWNDCRPCAACGWAGTKKMHAKDGGSAILLVVLPGQPMRRLSCTRSAARSRRLRTTTGSTWTASTRSRRLGRTRCRRCSSLRITRWCVHALACLSWTCLSVLSLSVLDLTAVGPGRSALSIRLGPVCRPSRPHCPFYLFAVFAL